MDKVELGVGGNRKDDIEIMISGDILERELEEILKAQTLDESMIEGLSVSDENGIIFCTNLADNKMFGWVQDEMISQQLIRQNNCSCGESTGSQETRERSQITGHWEGKFVNRRNDGTLLAKFAQITTLEYGGRKYWVRIQEDITERKRAEVAQAYLAAIMESSDDAIIGETLQGIITSWNKGAEKFFGYTSSEIIGLPINTLTPPDRQKEEVEILQRLGRGERIDHFETVRLRKDGTSVDVSLTISPIKDSFGRIIGATGIARDIGERNRVKEALRRGEAEFRGLLERLPAGAYICNADGLITYYNQRAVEIWGRTPRLNDGEDRFCDSFKLYTPDGTRLRHDQCGMALAPNEDSNHNGREIVIERPDGTRISALAHANPIRDASGMLIGAVNVLVEIGDRKRTEIEREELLKKEKAALAEAQAATCYKDEFLSLVSHELRSPITSILVYNHLLRSNPHDTEQIDRTCEIIERNARTQLGLIDDLLDTARIISGKLRLDMRPTDIVPVLVNVHNVVRPAAEAKGVKLRVHYGQTSEMIIGDSVRLQQVTWNLLSNAIKFTPAGGRVELWLERNEEDLYIIVSDTGIGIDPEYLPYIFDSFRQADPASPARQGGLGLGLTLAKHLVELHGGTIEAASEGVGFGSAFTVKLPLAKQSESLEAEPPTIRPEDAITLPDRPMIEGVRVLVADDQQDVRIQLADFLRKCGAIVVAVSTGIAALSIMADPLNGDRPDVLICDIALPDEDGYEVLRRLRTLEATRGATTSQRIPAIALTAMASQDDWVHARSAGFDMYVPKPVEPAELVTMIANLLRNESKGA
jgi:PAS domain S-box-containing protein